MPTSGSSGAGRGVVLDPQLVASVDKLAAISLKLDRVLELTMHFCDRMGMYPSLMPDMMSTSPLQPCRPLVPLTALDVLGIKVEALRAIFTGWDPLKSVELKDIDGYRQKARDVLAHEFMVVDSYRDAAVMDLVRWHSRADELWTQLILSKEVAAVFYLVLHQWLMSGARSCSTQPRPSVNAYVHFDSHLCDAFPTVFSPDGFIRSHGFTDAAFKAVGEVRAASRNLAIALWANGVSSSEVVMVLLEAALAFEFGLPVIRCKGELWMWSLDAGKVKHAWAVMQDFARETGLQWNLNKSGSLLIDRTLTEGSTSSKLPELPEGPVRWGWLVLRSTGAWEIDMDQIEQLATKSRAEMNDCRTFIDKVLVLNKAQALVARNVGPPIAALGRHHIRQAQAALSRLETLLTDGSDIVTFLRTCLHKFVQHDIVQSLPPGVFVWPLELGGLQLHQQQLLFDSVADRLVDFESRQELPYAECFDLAQERHTESSRRWYSDDVLVERFEAAAPGSTSRYADWAASLQTKPEMVGRDTSLLLSIAHDSFWAEVYEDLLQRVEVSGMQYASRAKLVHYPMLRAIIGPGRDAAISPLIPRQALEESSEIVKQVYARLRK